MKAREVENYLNSMGFEKGSSYCLKAIAEHSVVQQQQLIDMAAQLDEMVNILSNFMVIGENLKNNMDKLKSKFPEDDLPHVTE